MLLYEEQIKQLVFIFSIYKNDIFFNKSFVLFNGERKITIFSSQLKERSYFFLFNLITYKIPNSQH